MTAGRPTTTQQCTQNMRQPYGHTPCQPWIVCSTCRKDRETGLNISNSMWSLIKMYGIIDKYDLIPVYLWQIYLFVCKQINKFNLNFFILDL